MENNINNESDVWVSGSDKINQLKALVVSALENYKSYWHSEGVTNWGYELIYDQQGPLYAIMIECGTHEKILINAEKSHVPNGAKFAVMEEVQYQTWKRLLNNLVCSGISNNYQTTVKLHREKAFPLHNSNSNNPLTPDDCKP